MYAIPQMITAVPGPLVKIYDELARRQKYH